MATPTAVKTKTTTLTAATVDTVTLTGGGLEVEVTNWGASNRISFTTDGSTPTVDGDNTYPVGPGQSLRVPGGTYDPAAAGAEALVVKLICSTANAYSVVAI
jgi:hypothetical protein